MKIFFTMCAGLSFFLLMVACSLPKNADEKPGDQSLVDNLNVVVNNWGDLASGGGPEIYHSWLPKRGVRARYHYARNYLAKALIEEMVGEKVYLSGPHTEDFHSHSDTTFGHYNPAFLNALHKLLGEIYADAAFVKNFQFFYDRELKMYLRTYYLSYEKGTTSEAIKEGYLAEIADWNDTKESWESPSFYLQEAFRPFADELSGEWDESYIEGGSSYDWYEAVTCPGFWLRRTLDGTADEFYELLELTLNTFDPAFLLENKGKK